MGSSKLETEMLQLGVIQNKINENHTYLVATNYWTPLNNNTDENKEDEEKTNILDSTTAMAKPKSKKWMRQLARQREHNIIIYSSATSRFKSKDLDLLTDGVSNREVFLPDNSKLRTSNKANLPFEQLSDAAREADILPGLKQSFLSINKMSEKGFTTIFHLGKKVTLTIATSKPPVLQGCKSNHEKLWMVSATQNNQISEEANNVYSLPSILQSI